MSRPTSLLVAEAAELRLDGDGRRLSDRHRQLRQRLPASRVRALVEAEVEELKKLRAEQPDRRGHEMTEMNILSTLLSTRKPGLSALLQDRHLVAERAECLAAEFRSHPEQSSVLKILRRLHVMDALLGHISATWHKDQEARTAAGAIVRSLYRIFGPYEVRERMQTMHLTEVLEQIGC